jgi:hypothetical protein
MMNDFELRIDGGWRGSSNWGAKVDREYFSCLMLERRINLLARSNAPSLE